MDNIHDAQKLLDALHLGEHFVSGNFSSFYKNEGNKNLDIDYNRLLMVSVEENKGKFLEKLYKDNGLFFKEIMHELNDEGLFFYEVEELQDIYFHPEEQQVISDSLERVNENFSYESFYSNDLEYLEESPSSIFDGNQKFSRGIFADFSSAISESFYYLQQMSVEIRIDLHLDQFMQTSNGQILLIDPVIFDEHFI